MNSKREIRAHYLSVRKALAPDSVSELSEKIQNRLFELKEYISARSVMAYADILNEVKTGRIIEKILADGKGLYLPRVAGAGLETVRIKNPKEELMRGTFGIEEPVSALPAALPGEIDLVLVPGVAFDEEGNRIGYGKGYYDRFLPKTSCPLAALAFEAQIAKALPGDENDKKINIIITEKRVIRI